MAFDYTGLRDGTVEPLIAQFGTVSGAQISVNDPGAGLPYESQIGNETLYDVEVVQTVFTKDHNNGTLVEENDVLFIVSTKAAVSPELADRIIVDSVTYQIVRVDPLKPGPVVMLWKVHARK